MPCSLSCSISCIFIIGMIYFYNRTYNNAIVRKYKSNMMPELSKLYEKISEERLWISIRGYCLGLILSCLIIYYNMQQKKDKMSNYALICIVISVSFICNYFYYILSPKTQWMLDHMESKEQVKMWLEMYREMQKNYHTGIVLGIIAVGFFGYAFRC